MASKTPPSDSKPAQKPRRLGRGLASLISSTRASAAAPPPERQLEPRTAGHYEPTARGTSPALSGRADGGPVGIPLASIVPNPHQPRRAFDKDQLAELADSIRQQGLLQPLLIVPSGEAAGGEYVLVAGERRLRAAAMAGLETVPCVVKQATEHQMLEWALVENIQRADLNPVERAAAFQDYMDKFGATQKELAGTLGLPRSTISNYIRILDLCDETQAYLLDGSLSFGHAKVLAGLAGQAGRQARLARKAAEGGLSVRQLERLVAATFDGGRDGNGIGEGGREATRAGKSQYIIDVEQQLGRTLGTKVVIRPGRGKHTGRIELRYNGLDDFDRIIGALGAELES